jgi:hypothetical protein
MGKITIKNVSTSNVWLSLPNLNFSRELAPQRVLPVTEEQYEEFNYDVGFNALVSGHYLVVNGLEDDAQPAQEESVTDSVEIARMLDELDIPAFAKFIPTAKTAEREAVVRLAVDKGITNQTFVTLINKYCDVDIINAISIKHQAEEK